MSKQIPEAIRGLSRERAPRFYNLTQKTPQPTIVESGQIWSTHGFLNIPGVAETNSDEPRLVVILTGTGNISVHNEHVTVAPISLMTWAATDFDLLVPDNESPLPYKYMIEVWNETPVLKAHLRDYLGKLSERAISVLRSIHVARLVDSELPASAKTWVGLPLMGESDARIAFQTAEIDAVEYLANLATAALFAELPATAASVRQVGSRKRFEIKPVFGSIGDYLKGPQRAFASNTLPSADVIISNSEGEDTFVLELLERRRESRIYLVVHQLSPSLEGRMGVIALVLAETEIRSDPTELHQNAEIQIGKVPHFDKNTILRVEIEVE